LPTLAHDLVVVASFNRPGGNATGVAMLTSALVAKRLELLVNLIPAAVVVGALVNPNSSNAISDTRDAQSAARVLKRQLFVLTASTERDFETVFATLARSSSDLIGIRPPHSFAYVDPRPSGP
jgi:putative ABC transport system substrate-binding protein